MFMDWRLNSLKRQIFPKLVYVFNLDNNPGIKFYGNYKAASYIYMEMERGKNSQDNLGRKKKKKKEDLHYQISTIIRGLE